MEKDRTEQEVNIKAWRWVITSSEMREKTIMYISALHINNMLGLSTQSNTCDNIF
jgi:hypothetical protein